MEVLITFSWTGGSQDVKRIVHAAMRSQNVDYVSPHLYGSGVEPLDAIQGAMRSGLHVANIREWPIQSQWPNAALVISVVHSSQYIALATEFFAPEGYSYARDTCSGGSVER